MLICRGCAVAHRLDRARCWGGSGLCPLCGEVHILFSVFESSLKEAELLAESWAQTQEALTEHQNEQIEGLQ